MTTVIWQMAEWPVADAPPLLTPGVPEARAVAGELEPTSRESFNNIAREPGASAHHT